MSQKLTPDLAKKVVRADLKNIIDKVGAGRPLTNVERGIFDTINIASEDLGKKRQLSLLSKWANGKRLNGAEFDEISDLLPEGSVRVSDDQVGVSVVDGGEEPLVGVVDLTVTSEQALGGDELAMGVEVRGYQLKNSEYAARFGISGRTLQRYVKQGEVVGELPPLDDGAKFLDWWGTHMKHKAPAWLVDYAGSSVVVEDVVDAQEPRGPSVDIDSVKGVNDMGLGMMRRVVEVSSVALARAHSDGQRTEITRCTKDFKEATTALRQLEKTRSDLLRGSGELLDRSQVRDEIVPIMNKLSGSFLESLIKVAMKVDPTMSREDARSQCIPERDLCFKVLQSDLINAA